MKKRSLSGIKSTGIPHLGNYMGMIKPAIDLQDEFEATYFVADYHALTSVKDAKAMRESTYRFRIRSRPCLILPTISGS